MKNLNSWIVSGISLILLFVMVPLSAQSEFKSSFNLGGGGEYNIFKSPGSLYSNLAGEYWGKDSLIISDMMADMGYDLGFVKVKEGKYILKLENDLWYRHYISNKDLNQTGFVLEGDYARILGQKVHLGGLYKFKWSDRVGTSVTGDLLMRSFKYLGNEGMVYLDFLPSNKVNMRLFTDYQYKIYYAENTLDPLDHGNLEVNYELNLEPSRAHQVNLELSVLDRQYSQYHALDANGLYDRANPLRHFRYYKAALDYNWKPTRGVRINPEVNFRRRVDMFEDYYSYISYGGGLRVRYMWSRYYISLYGDYRHLKYDIREAFTTQPNDPQLVYGYLDYTFTFKYDIAERWQLSLSAGSDNRSSNSDLDYLKTRRGYNNYEALMGIIYTLPVIKWD